MVLRSDPAVQVVVKDVQGDAVQDENDQVWPLAELMVLDEMPCWG